MYKNGAISHANGISLKNTNVSFFFSSQINIRNAEKTSTINKAFAEVQKEIQQISKGTAAEPQKNQKVISLCKNLTM